MFARPALLISIVQAALLLGTVEARIWLLERDGRAIFARRFGQAQPEVLREIAAACGGGICEALADEAVSCSPLTRSVSLGFPLQLLTKLPRTIDELLLFVRLDCSAVGRPTGVFTARHG